MAADSKMKYLATATVVSIAGYPDQRESTLFGITIGLAIGIGNPEAAEALIGAAIPVLDEALGGPGYALTEAEVADARATLAEIAKGASLVL